MYNYLPSILTSNIPYDTTLDATNDFLFRFLKLFAFQLDTCKSQAENITNRYDVTNLNGLLIPAFMQEFGLKYEPNLGLKQSRIFLRNISLLYQSKGTKTGLNEFIKAYAGFDNIINRGKNLMLDQNDSSFEQSIGSWASVANATLAHHLASDSPTIVPYNDPSLQPDFPNLQNATLQVTAVASGDVKISLSGDTPMHYGIPVTGGLAYAFSAQAQTGATARAISAQIYWYDRKGVALTPSTAGSSVNDATSSWTKFTSAVTAPSTAFFAVPVIKIASAAAGEIHYFDAVQFEQNTTATYFQDARQIEVTLIANRINEITNPNFVSPETGWTVTNGTITVSTDPADILGVDGSVTNSAEAGEIYASAAGLVTLTSESIPVFSSNEYTFSIYSCATDPGDAAIQVTPYVSWYDSSSTLIHTTTGTPEVATSTFVRPFVTEASPTNAVTAKVGITWTATAAGSAGNGNQVVVDSALFERSAFVNSYFDGSNGVAELSDLFWEGTANASRSHYYRNRFAVQSRLVKELPNWINYGSTFELFLAQPNT
jgi:phage tail-like protein